MKMPLLRPIAERAEELLCLAFQKRAKVALGSDAGAYMVPHGRGICQEFDFFLPDPGKYVQGDRMAQKWRKRNQGEISEEIKSGKSGNIT